MAPKLLKYPAEQFMLSREGYWFSVVGKTIQTELLCNKNVLVDGQISQAKLSSQPVNLPDA